MERGGTRRGFPERRDCFWDTYHGPSRPSGLSKLAAEAPDRGHIGGRGRGKDMGEKS